MGHTKLPADVLREHKGKSFTGISTTFMCYDSHGKVFMAKRGKAARDEQGNWDLGGGGLKWGSTIENNIRREIKEEYGADVRELTFMGYREVFRKLNDGTQTHWIAFDYAAFVEHSQLRNNEPDAFDDVGWFGLNDLPSPLHSQLPAYLDKYRATIANVLGQPR